MLVNVHGQPITSQKEIVIRNPKIAEFAALADRPFAALGLTVVCVACGQTPQMANAPTDATWQMDCSCTRRRLLNPTTRVRARDGQAH